MSLCLAAAAGSASAQTHALDFGQRYATPLPVESMLVNAATARKLGPPFLGSEYVVKSVAVGALPVYCRSNET
jgi:hypothetical protein